MPATPSTKTVECISCGDPIDEAVVCIQCEGLICEECIDHFEEEDERRPVCMLCAEEEEEEGEGDEDEEGEDDDLEDDEEDGEGDDGDEEADD